MFALVAGVAAGLVHVVSGPDHLAAVAPLAADRNRPQWRAGLQWGLGHTAGVLLIGALLISFREVLPIDLISGAGERIVGVALLVIAVWAFARARAPRPHVHAAVGASFAMGTLHGVAGSSHFFGILPALALPTQVSSVLYLAGFGIGAVLGMTVFSTAIGALASVAAKSGVNAYRGILYACSIAAFVVGSVWLVA